MTQTITALEASVPTGLLLLAKSVAIVLVAALASRTVVRTANARGRLWRCVYASLALLPVLQFVLPETQLQMFSIQHADLATPVGTGTRTISLGRLIAVVWLVGAVIALLRLMRDWHAAHRLVTRSASLVDARIPSLLAEVVDPSIQHRVRLRVSPEIATPSMFGWRRPLIVLPVNIVNWTDDEVRAVLLHELQHVRHYDWPVMIAERLVGAFYWPNALLAGAHRSAAAVRELLADRAVVQGTISPKSYATQLMRMSRHRHAAPSRALTVAFAHDSVEHRVRALFLDDSPSARYTARAKHLGVLVMFVFVAGIATVRPWACAPEVIVSDTSRL